MYWDKLKIIRNIVNNDNIPSSILKEEEYNIVSAEAKHVVGQEKFNGELTVTNKRIVFSAKSCEDISLGLDEIELLKSNRNVFAINDKLTIVSKGKENVFFLNYSEDWINIIEHLLKQI